jgi:hypothetical protein
MNAIDLTNRGFGIWASFARACERDLLAGLPIAPGVYVILLPTEQPRRHGHSDIGYIGRAVNQNGVRGRVRQYFHPGPTQSTNIAMRQRLSAPDCALRLGFITTDTSATAKRLESDLLIAFEAEHGELPPFNRQRALDRISRLSASR